MTRRDQVRRVLEGALAAPVAGLITGILVAWAWGGLDVPGLYHDERAYVVQARLLAHFSWTAPTPPVPLAWLMPHVFIEPAIFAKYPPGHALLLVPGLWLGLPGLMPVLFAALAGSLVFLLARRLAGPWIAVITWAIWSLAPETVGWHASYFSESTTTLLWLAALWLLLEWRAAESSFSLVAFVACVAWIGITRPVTAIALGAPLAIAVLWTAWSRRRLRGWLAASGAGLLVMSIVPYWSVQTSGQAWPLPYSDYSRQFFPWDMPGFVRDSSPPLRALPQDFEHLAVATKGNYEGHVAARMPRNFVERTVRVMQGGLGPVAAPAWLLVPIGLAVSGTVGLFGAASLVALMAAYLVMPHTLAWTIYYLEVMPLVAFFGVVGGQALLWRVARSAEARRWSLITPRRLQWFGVVTVIGTVLQTASFLPELRAQKRHRSARQLLAQLMIRELDDPRAVIFVHRDTGLTPHVTLWDILGPPESTPTWVVRSLDAASNARLLSAAGDRRPYALDERTMTLSPLQPPTESSAAAEPE